MTDLRARLQSSLSDAYTLDRELGGGGMSRVFVADETRLGRTVVVKVLSPELAAGISAERFEREIRLAASLQQANIVPVLSVGDAQGLPYYTMPYVEGESLRARLGGGAPIGVTEIVRILGDVARALQYAHERGVVHRDIKPDNVLLSGGTAVVTDFGIAKAVERARQTPAGTPGTEGLTAIGTSIGTPAYMAPEQAAGDPDVDQRADVYALGVLGYELLAGRTPFQGRTAAQMLAAHMAEEPRPVTELRPDAPGELASLVMRCLAKTPDERPQSAAEVIGALEAITSGSGMSALPPVLLHGPAAFRRALAWWAAAVVAVALVARAATVVIGLPDWVLPGALLVMALGLPVILFTGYVQRVTRRVLAAPTLTPGGHTRTHGTLAGLALRASPHVSWTRTARGGMLALASFVALIIGFMVLRAYGIGPAGSLFAAGKLSERDAVLIADFGVSGADLGVANVVAEGVRAQLSQSTSITIFGRTSVASALQRMEKPRDSRVTLELARQIAAREGVKAIVDGDVTALGQGYVVSLRLVSADSGQVLASHQATAAGPADLIATVDEVTRELRGRMGESLRTVRASPPLEQVTTSSLEALRLYTDASRRFDLHRDYLAAIPLLRRAVAIDTGFATAWRKLGTAMGNMYYRQSTVDSAVNRAFALRHRLTDQERLLTEGYYYFRGAGRDRVKALAAYEALLQRGDSVFALNNLGSLHSSRREWAKAESLYRVQLRMRPDLTTSLSNLEGVLENQGRFAAADSALRELQRLTPENPRVVERALMRHYRARRYDDFERAIDSAQVGATPEVRLWLSYGKSAIAGARGRLAQQERLLLETQALDSAQLGTPKPPAIVDSANLALNDAWFRTDSARALRRLDGALAATPLARLPEADRPYNLVAAAYAMAGRPDRARAVLAQMRREIRDTALLRDRAPGAEATLGLVLIAEGKPLEGVAALRRGDRAPDGPTGNYLATLFHVARGFDRAALPDSAIAHYEQYLADPHTARIWEDQNYLAATHKRLGELYEARGSRDKAIQHYATFVDLWKNADPELRPLVEDVRKRLRQPTDAPKGR
ncbi:MAG TPA: protein kinase [Gemmatimonadaceae bacterium]|nr:protein kinase [Gemmatimonadaceae bacterium]